MHKRYDFKYCNRKVFIIAVYLQAKYQKFFLFSNQNQNCSYISYLCNPIFTLFPITLFPFLFSPLFFPCPLFFCQFRVKTLKLCTKTFSQLCMKISWLRKRLKWLKWLKWQSKTSAWVTGIWALKKTLQNKEEKDKIWMILLRLWLLLYLLPDIQSLK